MIRSLLVLSLALLLGSPAPAAELIEDNWSGHFRINNEEPKKTVFKVKQHKKKGLQIKAKVKDLGTLTFEEPKLSDAGLGFKVDAGDDFSCLLTPGEEGTYGGDCQNINNPDDPTILKFFMRPPAETEQPTAAEEESAESGDDN